MSFPKNHINRRTRIIIMILLIGSFFVISPIIILYTAGYRYDFQNNIIKETGVISIDAKPTDAEVSVNGVVIKNKLPIWLPNHAPGIYQIKIKKDGYQEWSKDITVESQKTAYIKNITLFKKASPIEILNDKNSEISAVYPSKDGDYFLLGFTNNKNLEIKLFETATKKLTSLWTGLTTNEPIISWSPFTNTAFIKSADKDKISLELIDPLDTANVKNYILSLTNKAELNYEWSKYGPAVYFNDEQKENLTNIKLYSLSESRLIGVTTSSLWYVDGNNYNEAIWSYDTKKQILSKSVQNNFSAGLKLQVDINKIIDANNQRIIAKYNNSILIWQLADGQIKNLVTLPTQSLFYNTNKKEWLTWSPWELWSVYDDGSMALLNRISEKINYVQPLDNYGILLLASDNKLIGFNPGYYLSNVLAENLAIKKITVSSNNRKIFFQGKVGEQNGIWELKY